MKGWKLTAVLLLGLTGTALAAKMPPPIEKCASEPVRYIGTRQTDKRFFDGAIPHAVGTHSYQAFRANRTDPPEGGDVGWTYNHQPYLAYWNGKFYLQYLSAVFEEHHAPGRTLIMTSEDGRTWSNPKVVFPKYRLPRIRKGEHMAPADVPEGTYSVMHQRMGFYIAPNGRLLTLAFYGFCATHRHSPNTGNGLGRVVREIYRDGSFGPIYFIRYNRHAGWNESNTSYPFYKTSPDKGFLEACEALLSNKLVTLQWWEEDRGKDGFYPIDPGAVKGAYDFKATIVSSRGAGKAFCFYRRPDGVTVGLWKNQWSALSPDDGKTWTPITKSPTLRVCGAKLWGQRTKDGRYALVYNHTQVRSNRFPMVVMTGDDGYEFDNMLCLHGEVPPMRYKGFAKVWGPQYIRGIIPGNGDPPGDYLWNVYSVNKEDIWITRTRLPVSGKVDRYVDQDFDQAQTEADLELWNLYVPKWAPVSIGTDRAKPENKFLQLRDKDRYDYAKVERIFPESRKVAISFDLRPKQDSFGRLEIDVTAVNGARALSIVLNEGGKLQALCSKGSVELGRYQPGRWMKVEITPDASRGTFSVSINGEEVLKSAGFLEKVDALQRLVFRTGRYRRVVPAKKPEKVDLPNAGVPVEQAEYDIDNVSIRP